MSKAKPHARQSVKIPPPPDPKEGTDAIIAYFDRYPTEELIRAGHLTDPTQEQLDEMEASGAHMLLRAQGVNLKLSDKDCKE